ncbi:hypothetical protein AB9K41_02045 [Cribrihabitans sp. XS_ASV171]
MTLAGNEAGTDPARQIGGGNVGEITFEGDFAQVTFNQISTSSVSGLGNSATITGGELAAIGLEQLGYGNTGIIEVSGIGNAGGLSQKGNDNFGKVIVSGTGNSGQLNQVGDRNTYTLQVGGTSTDVTYTQVGNDLSSSVSPSVFSNGGTVVITQSVSR